MFPCRDRYRLGAWVLVVLAGVGPLAAEETAVSVDADEVALERLPDSPQLLEAPVGVAGDFVIAREAPAIDFAIVPGQWEGARLWSSWGDSEFASDGRFYASIGDHGAPFGTSYVYQIDPEARTVRKVVDVNAVVGLTDETQYAPGKIHGALVDGRDGWLYLFSYFGSPRQTGEETGYRGDWLLRYHLESGRTENLGIPIPDCGVPVLGFHEASRSLYGLASPGQTADDPHHRFFRYGLADQTLRALGGPAPNLARALILADDGRAFYSHNPDDDEPGVFVRYDPAENAFTVLALEVPGDGRLRAASRPDRHGVVFCLSHDGVVFAFDTRDETIRQLGEALPFGTLYTATCRLDPSGRLLYYLPGAHGRTAPSGTPIVQFDLQTGRRKVIAFLNEYLRQRKHYNLGGTYGIALSDDGSQLCVNFNGAPRDAQRPDFGLCSVMIVHIPGSERRVE